MANPSSTNAGQKKGGWGSLFTGAVAGLESRLDTILTEENNATARPKAVTDVGKQTKSSVIAGNQTPASASRDASRTRANGRLAERLAKATSAKAGGHSRTGSSVPSRVASPALESSSRSSVDVKRSSEEDKEETVRAEDTVDAPPAVVEPEIVLEEEHVASAESSEVPEKGTLLTSTLPINPARLSIESSRLSMETPVEGSSTRQSVELTNGSIEPGRGSSELEREILRMRDEHARAEKDRQEEMLIYMEKIDALQAKLKYLAKDTVAAAKEANASTQSPESRLAEKDEKIALLMEEGDKLSKIELRHLQTIKKLRAKGSEDDKVATDMRIRATRAEKAEAELKQKVKEADAAERERTKQIAGISMQIDELQADRENASELIRNLTVQLKEAKDRADRAEKKASSVDEGKIASLENELEDAQIEKRLAHDRSQAEVRKLKEDLETQKQRSSVGELEMKNEVAGLESRLEALRSRAEEADTGESNVKLLRQVETLQSQYAVAKENWETIEGSLNARMAAIEKERDEAGARENEARKKTRDVLTKARRAEEALDSKNEELSTAVQELRSQKDLVNQLRQRLEDAETALTDSRNDTDRQRKLWEAELTQRLEEEKSKPQRPPQLSRLDSDSPTTHSRKFFNPDTTNPTSRRATPRLQTDLRPVSRRSSAVPFSSRSNNAPANFFSSPSLSRQPSFDTAPNAPPIPPSIEIDADADIDAASSQSPHRAAHDLMSASAVSTGAGPSVQLVERMSAAVRRLEAEKAGFKDELGRLSAQRDEARDEVVGLMREAEGSREEVGKVRGLEREMRDLRRRYEASLEMLGEREEECLELKEGVAEVKRLYRELVEKKMGGGGKV